MGCAIAASAEIEATYAQHTRAVELARAGRHAEGLALLRGLLERFPTDYPLNRDAILVATWAGDCGYALERYHQVRTHPRLDAYLVMPLANCAVARAREGDYATGLSVLEALRPHVADPYPLQRDLALIAAWSGDCARALGYFDAIRDDARHEPFLITPMADCMVQDGRPADADALTAAALVRHPADGELLAASLRAQVAGRLHGGDWDRIVVEGGLTTDDAEPGPREWRGTLLARAGVASTLRVQARLLATADANVEAGVAPGDLRRAGLGLGWRPMPRLELLQELSTDLRISGQGGSTTRLSYRPGPTLSFNAVYATFAEDLPLRARLSGVEANHSALAGAYHSRDYVWDGRAGLDRYDFTDGNRRDGMYATMGYAYQMLPEREQRLYLDGYRSRNTLDTAPYFNPRSDSSIGLTHRTTFVLDTRYKRHVDSLSIWLASYRQEGFGSKARWGVTYEQDYDFDDDLALVYRVSWQRNVYDGGYENAARGEVYFRRRF